MSFLKPAFQHKLRKTLKADQDRVVQDNVCHAMFILYKIEILPTQHQSFFLVGWEF